MTRITANTKRNSTQDDTANVPAHIAKARAMRANGATKQEIARATIQDFVIGMARQELGNEFKTAQIMAKALESLSEDVLAGNYDKLLAWRMFPKLHSFYESTYELIGELYLKALAPNALSFYEFMSACQTTTRATISPTCKACGSILTFSSDFVIDIPLDDSLEIMCECSKCGLESLLDIEIAGPQSEENRMIRSYIRSLLVFEEYDKAHELGPIVDRRVLASVATQAAKAFVHLPSAFSIDYQTLVLEEMQR